MQVGDKVKKRITTAIASMGYTSAASRKSYCADEMVSRTGRVIYIHPKNRFYTAEFVLQNATIRESYDMREALYE